jgi:hypothetical protein
VNQPAKETAKVVPSNAEPCLGMNKNNSIEFPDADVVTMERLAESFGVEKSVCRKWLVKNGFEMRFIRVKESGNQLCAALNRQEAIAAINLRKAQGFRVNKF